ncbi:helix-turn-helix domain-containing protein [Pedobacter alluvionis]|uniref:AraC family transcriptional regulator n=1 Tax=Pedobacter alluvionis TaxID=475253 RepID=A0A497YCL0_9SPHI|nr:helix-turn-helix domain-containing protein [Pedobacter alluvionis]RLJ80207.1 AraC-like DNA-binding protein [Pedobacter alluvionis]TFB31491.1 AraC family transcriptional regulator [Pedobacter alluvionis]
MQNSSPAYTNYRINIPEGYEKVFTHFYYAKNNTGEIITKKLIPSYQTILIFSFAESPYFRSKQNLYLEVNKYLMLGPIKHIIEYALPPNAEMLLVNFKDDAFFRFFGNATIAEHLPMVPNESVNEDPFMILWHELNNINDIQAKVNHILQFSAPYFESQSKIAEQLINFNDETLSPIKSIAGQNKQTERNTQLNHQKHFGYSAKEYNRYTRFIKAIALIDHIAFTNAKIDWFEVVGHCGYYDQSQLINDFKHFIELSPTKYLKFQQDICNAKS